MEINRVAFGVLAAACITAAGGGAYLATRHASTEQGVAASAPTDAVAAPGAQASADVVTPAPAAVAPAQPSPAFEASSSRPAMPPARVEPARRVTRRPPPATISREEAGREARAERDRGASPVPAPEAQAQAPLTATAAPAAQFSAPPAAPEPQPEFEELTVAANQVIGLQVDATASSETARIEDRVDARITRDVKVGDRVAIPAGSRALGSVTLVDRGGKLKDRARLGVRFHTIVLADGTRVPVQSDVVFREGASPAAASSAKIGGGAIGGAIIGGILGGRRGAVLGSTAGAGAGTAAVMAGDRNAAVLRAGETVTVRLMQPLTVAVEKD